jgi:4-diphosphocytidyl-2-C-methyl-D-erythritol kinase
MVVFPNAKINLGLNIISKREDGYHDLETVFYPIPVQDALEINRATNSINSFIFNTSGILVPGDSSTNLCVKAYELLKTKFQLPPIEMHLHKAIPMGAGLGGGSSDGAFTLLLLNKKFNLGIPEDQLISYALELGSDCPFFIRNRPCYATGRGEIMEDVAVNLSGYQLLLVNPGIHVSTKEAFAGIRPSAPKRSAREIVQQPIDTWKDQLLNDFEATVFGVHPELADIKESMYAHGAVYAAMTGTGSSIFGIFSKQYKYDHFADNQPYVKFVGL